MWLRSLRLSYAMKSGEINFHPQSQAVNFRFWLLFSKRRSILQVSIRVASLERSELDRVNVFRSSPDWHWPLVGGHSVNVNGCKRDSEYQPSHHLDSTANGSLRVNTDLRWFPLRRSVTDVSTSIKIHRISRSINRWRATGKRVGGWWNEVAGSSMKMNCVLWKSVPF